MTYLAGEAPRRSGRKPAYQPPVLKAGRPPAGPRGPATPRPAKPTPSVPIGAGMRVPVEALTSHEPAQRQIARTAYLGAPLAERQRMLATAQRNPTAASSRAVLSAHHERQSAFVGQQGRPAGPSGPLGGERVSQQQTRLQHQRLANALGIVEPEAFQLRPKAKQVIGEYKKYMPPSLAEAAKAAKQQGVQVDKGHYYRNEPMLAGLLHRRSEVVPVKQNGKVLFGTQYQPSASGDIMGASWSELTGKGAITGKAIPALASLVKGIPIAGNAAKDVVETLGEAVPSTYHALEPLARGDLSAVGKNLASPYEELWHHPGKSFENHPLSSLLLLAGPLHGGLKGVGRIGRAAGALAPTLAGEARVLGTGLKENVRVSDNPLLAAYQRQRIKSKVGKAEDLRGQALAMEQHAAANPQDASAGFDKAAQLRAQANRVDPFTITKRGIRGRVDILEGMNFGLQGRHRTAAVKAVNKALTGVSTALHPLVNIVAQGIAGASHHDIQSYIDELAAETQKMGATPEGRAINAHKIAANEELRAALQRGLAHNPDFAKIHQAAENVASVLNSHEQKLINEKLLDPNQAERSRLIPYAVRKMGARYMVEPDALVERNGQLMRPEPTIRGPNGEQLTTAQIRAHMAAHGENHVSEPAYLTHAMPTHGRAGMFYQPWSTPAAAESRARTGAATTQGVFDVHPEMLTAQAAKTQGLVDRVQGYRRFMDQFGWRRQGDKVHTFTSHGKATLEAQRLYHATGQQWRPVRARPFHDQTPEALQKLIDDTAGHPEKLDQHTWERVHDALAGTPDKGKGSWILVPDEAAARLQAHVKLLGGSDLTRGLQKANSLFRRTVLMHPSWIYGNVAEAAFRGAVNRTLPFLTRDYWMMRKAIDALPLDKRDEALEAVGVGHMGYAGRAPRRAVAQMGDNLAGRMGRRAQASPLLRGALKGWDRVNHVWFNEINGRLENQFRLAQAGKATRQVIGREYPSVSAKAVREAADGLMHTHNQVEMLRLVNDAYGKYSSFSPRMRQAMVLYTPFVAWTMNALTFGLRTLPADHPLITTLLADVQQSSEEWRKAHKLTMFGPASDRLPYFLQGTIPGKDGSHLRGPTRYTPAGFWANPLETMAGNVLPGASGVLAAFGGQDWTGRPLKDDSIGGRAKAAIGQLAGGFVPGEAQVSTVLSDKEGPLHGLRKLGDPFMWTQAHEKAGKSGRAVSPFGSGRRKLSPYSSGGSSVSPFS